MKKKIECYVAYTTFLYRLLGMALIPCAFWLLCVLLLWSRYGGPMGAERFDGIMSGIAFALSEYVAFYEICTDYWVLGGCLSDGGRGLRYFRTSRRGAEVLGNIVVVDLAGKFLGCMVFSGIVFLFTGWRTVLVMGLSMYCVVVGALHISRHIDGLQKTVGVAILVQVGVAVVNVVDVLLIELTGVREEIMLACLAALYCLAAFCVSGWMVRRITNRVVSGGI